MSLKRSKLTGPVLRWPDAMDCAGVGQTVLREMIDAGTFPKPVKVSDAGRAVVFLRKEIEEWLQKRIEARDQAQPAPKAVREATPKPPKAKKQRLRRAGATP